MGTIRDEILQTRPFRSPAEEALVTLVATTDRVRAALHGVAAEHDLTLQQYNVLRILRGAGPQGLPTLDVASRMIDRSPGITRLLERLETRRLVRRVRCPEDRRQVLCHATARALALMPGLDARMLQAAERCFAPLDAHRTVQLVEMLDLVRAAAAAATPQPPKPDSIENTKETRE